MIPDLRGGDDESNAVAFVLTQRQRADSVAFAEVYTQAGETGENVRIIADKAYDGGDGSRSARRRRV